MRTPGDEVRETKPFPAMTEVAQALMAEYAEMDLSLVIWIKALPPTSRLG